MRGIVSQLENLSLSFGNVVNENSIENMKAFHTLKEQTDLITDTAKSIRNISSQTNILALNADSIAKEVVVVSNTNEKSQREVIETQTKISATMEEFAVLSK